MNKTHQTFTASYQTPQGVVNLHQQAPTTASAPTATKSRGKKYIKQEEQQQHQHHQHQQQQQQQQQHIQIQQHHPQYTQHIQIQPHHQQTLVQQNVLSGLSTVSGLPATITIQPQVLTTHQTVQGVQTVQVQGHQQQYSQTQPQAQHQTVMQVQQQQQQQQVANQTDTKIGIILNDDSEYGINNQGELDQGCRKCHVLFGSSTELKLHFATSHNRQTFECFVCNKLYLQKYNFLAHIERYHDETAKSFPCQFCDKVFTLKTALDTHLAQQHKTPLLICPLCQRSFPQASSLKQHVQMDHGDPSKVQAPGPQQFKCGDCGKTYKSQSGLTIHSKTKHQVTQYSCNICGKHFSRSSNVARHIDTIHIMAKTYPCKWCGKEFRSTGGRDMHVQAEHQGTRYDCNICFKQFKRKGSLARHMVGVHDQGNLRYRCGLCGKEFKQKSHLKTHFKNLHNQEMTALPPPRPATNPVQAQKIVPVIQGTIQTIPIQGQHILQQNGQHTFAQR